MQRDRKDGQGNAPNQHQHLDVQARVAEQLSRLAEQRYRAVVPEGCKAEEAARLIREAIQAELDAAESNAVEEFGSVIDRTIKSRRYHDQAAAFKRETAQKRVQDFVQRAEQDLPGYREVYDTLKRYVLGEITAAEMQETAKVHLDLYPVTLGLETKPWRGKDNWSLDYGGAMTGWHALAFMIPEHVSLWRFRVCPQCGRLFYDASHAGNKKSCGDDACKRLRKTLAKRHERSKTP